MREWWFSPSLEGDSLILGRGYDYDGMMVLDEKKEKLIIKLCVSLADLRKVIGE